MESVYIAIARYSQKNDRMQKSIKKNLVTINTFIPVWDEQTAQKGKQQKGYGETFQFPEINNVLKISNYQSQNFGFQFTGFNG